MPSGAPYNDSMSSVVSTMAAAAVAAALFGQAAQTRATRPPAGDAPVSVSLFAAEAAPSEATLGVALYPAAVFLTSYDAGRGQRYYLFGSTSSFSEMVAYYRTLLKERGTLVYEQPQTHIFETGRYNEDTMAFPPSVTVKDYTWGGSPGLLNPTPGAQPERFPTVIQIVPTPR